MNHPAHLVNADKSLSPSAFVPFCAFKANLSIAGSVTMHPNLSFPVCSSFVPDILEGQLCYTLKINETGGKGKQNGLMLLLDLNENRDFYTSLHYHPLLDDKYRMNLDTENSMHDISAKIQINAMLPDTKYGPGSYMMTSVKEMIATDEFIGLNSKTRNCEIESYAECRTRNLLAHCGCVPWELNKMRVIYLHAHNVYQFQTALCSIFQGGAVCNSTGRSCIDDGIKESYGCKTSCEGIHVDVQWIDEDVGKSRDGGREESKDAFNRLVEEYREYKRNYSRAFRFLASANKKNFGLCVFQL